MTPPDHLKITGPEDILGFIPHSLGYWPENSLVAMTMQGKRLGATLRLDLPGGSPTGGPAGSKGGMPGGVSALADFARTVASYLAADDEADGSLLALFTGRDGGAGPWAPLLAELELALREGGMPVRDAWIIGADFWRNAYCTDPDCCAPGRPVEEIRNSRLNAEMVLRGSMVGAAPGAAAEPPQPEDPAALEAELDWAKKFFRRRRSRTQFTQVLDVWARVLHAVPARQLRPGPTPDLPVGLAGYLRASLCVQAWRDAVLVMAAAGHAAAERGPVEFGIFDGSAGPPAPMPPLDGFPAAAPPLGAGSPPGGTGGHPPEAPGYGEVLLGLAPAVPDWALMVRLERVLTLLGADGSGESRAASLTARGWIEWCRGRGSFADALFSRALQECPGYRLADLLAELARRGTVCGWASKRDAAWQKFTPDAA